MWSKNVSTPPTSVHGTGCRPSRCWSCWPRGSIFTRRFAYRCLPLAIANQVGWEIINPCTFTASWNGKDGLDAIKIRFHGEASVNAEAVLGIGEANTGLFYGGGAAQLGPQQRWRRRTGAQAGCVGRLELISPQPGRHRDTAPDDDRDQSKTADPC